MEKKITSQVGTLTICGKNFDLVKLKINNIEQALNVVSSIEVLSAIGKKPAIGNLCKIKPLSCEEEIMFALFSAGQVFQTIRISNQFHQLKKNSKYSIIR